MKVIDNLFTLNERVAIAISVEEVIEILKNGGIVDSTFIESGYPAQLLTSNGTVATTQMGLAAGGSSGFINEEMIIKHLTNSTLYYHLPINATQEEINEEYTNFTEMLKGAPEGFLEKRVINWEVVEKGIKMKKTGCSGNCANCPHCKH